MASWQITFDVKTLSFSHRVSPNFGHALFTPLVSDVFQVVRVAASIFHDGFWWPIHDQKSMLEFDLEMARPGPS